MLPSSLGSAVKLGISDHVTFTFVFSGRALDRVMLNYIIIKDISKMTTTLIEDFAELNRMYYEYIDDLMDVVKNSAFEAYKPVEWRNK